MSVITKEISETLIGHAPIERIVAVYEDPRKFYAEMTNYLIGGLVVSCSKFFMMVKPIDSSKPPSGQWWAKDPDCWYVRWVAGEDCMKTMFNAVEPLPKVMFRRLTVRGETGLKIVEWDRIYKKVCHG